MEPEPHHPVVTSATELRKHAVRVLRVDNGPTSRRPQSIFPNLGQRMADLDHDS